MPFALIVLDRDRAKPIAKSHGKKLAEESVTTDKRCNYVHNMTDLLGKQ